MTSGGPRGTINTIIRNNNRIRIIIAYLLFFIFIFYALLKCHHCPCRVLLMRPNARTVDVVIVPTLSRVFPQTNVDGTIIKHRSESPGRLADAPCARLMMGSVPGSEPNVARRRYTPRCM